MGERQQKIKYWEGGQRRRRNISAGRHSQLVSYLECWYGRAGSCRNTIADAQQKSLSGYHYDQPIRRGGFAVDMIIYHHYLLTSTKVL